MSVTYIGDYERSLDNKGHASFPSKLRTGFEQGVYLKAAVDSSPLILFLFPQSYLRNMAGAESSTSGPDLSLEDLLKKTDSLLGLKESYIDGQGRLLIPKSFLKPVERPKKVYFFGLIDCVGLYLGSEASFQKFRESHP